MWDTMYCLNRCPSNNPVPFLRTFVTDLRIVIQALLDVANANDWIETLMSKMAFRSDLEAVILGVLEDGPKHGYAIVKQLLSASEGLIRLGEGQLYPTLHKLEQSGHVTAEWAVQEGKPSRRVYSLTALGQRELSNRRLAWEKFRSSIDSVLKVG